MFATTTSSCRCYDCRIGPLSLNVISIVREFSEQGSNFPCKSMSHFFCRLVTPILFCMLIVLWIFFLFLNGSGLLEYRWWSVNSSTPPLTQTLTTEENKSAETIQKSMIERCLIECLYQVYLWIFLCRKKVFILHSLSVTQNCSKHLAFRLMSEYLCHPIRPLHVLLSVITCALKSPSKTIDFADVTFCKAIPTLSKKGWYFVSAFDMYTCKMHSDHSCSLSLRRYGTTPPNEIQSVTQWAKRGLTKCLTLPEQTWLHLRSYTWVEKLPAVIELNSIRAMPLGRGNSNNIKMILLCLSNQFLFFSIEWSDFPVAHGKIPMVATNSSTDTVRCSHLPLQTRRECIDGFPVTVSLWGKMSLTFQMGPLPKAQT